MTYTFDQPVRTPGDDRELVEVTLLLADISGYTRFVSSPRMSLLHAQVLIDDLMAAVAGAVGHPLGLWKIEGDATFFYALPDSAEARRAVIDAAPRILETFVREQARIEVANMCSCEACDNVHDLRLKFVTHAGEAVVRGGEDQMDLAGPNVILAHRLLKNSVPDDEYLLMTPPIAEELNADEAERAHRSVEEVEDLGTIQTTWLPLDREPIVERISAESRGTGFAERISQTMHVHVGTMRHALRGDADLYDNLPSREEAAETST